MDATTFSYNGNRSEDLGVLLVRTESGMFSTPFMADKEILSDHPFQSTLPIIYGFQDKPIPLKITIALDDGLFWTTDKRREVARFLDCGKFAEFYSTDDIDKIYFLCFEKAPDLMTNGLKQGYVDVYFRSLSPYAYTSVYQQIFDFTSLGADTTTFTYENKGDKDLYPQQMWITKTGAGDVTITNLSDGGRVFEFTGLADNETVYIENEDRYISTSLSETYRYDAFNGNYLKVVRGVNTFQITGACSIEFKSRFILKG